MNAAIMRMAAQRMRSEPDRDQGAFWAALAAFLDDMCLLLGDEDQPYRVAEDIAAEYTAMRDREEYPLAAEKPVRDSEGVPVCRDCPLLDD